jgi:hypothetical protein
LRQFPVLYEKVIKEHKEDDTEQNTKTEEEMKSL